MAGTRALARIGWRDITRHRLRSLLIVLLIALPVAAMVGAIAILRTTAIPAERWATARFGEADLIAQGVGRVDLVRSRLPEGSQLEPYAEGQIRLVLPGARPSATLRAANIGGLAAGIYTLLEGSAPAGTSEAAISTEVARIAKLGIGDRISVEDQPDRTIVGIIENPLYLADRSVVVDPTAYVPGEMDSAGWLIRLPNGEDPGAYGGEIKDPATGEPVMSLEVRGQSGSAVDASPTILILGTMALVEAALIASAAFAVSIRRRQRELGLLAATGATPGQLSRSVLLEALMLGLVSCVAGVIGGLTASCAFHPFLDNLTQHRNPPLVVDASGILGPMAIGLVASLVAAWLPARTVSRTPVLLALSGRRPAHRSAGRGLWLGVLVVAVGLGLTIAGATFEFDDGDIRQYLILGGAVLGTLGFGACAPWLLEQLDRVARRLPLTSRIAFRDTARARSRNAPIVTAVLAGLAAVIAIGAWSASRDAEDLRGWRPTLWPDQIRVSGAGASQAAQELLQEPGVASATTVGQLVPTNSGAFVAFTLPDARGADGKLINQADQCTNCTPGAFQPYQVIHASSATPELLALAHAQEGAADLAAGRAVIVSDRVAVATTMRILIYSEDGTADPETIDVPVRVIPVSVSGGVLPDAFIPEPVIKQLGMVQSAFSDYGGPETYVVQYAHAVSGAELDRATAIAGQHLDTVAYQDSAPVRPGQGFRLLLIAMVLLFSLSVTGIALALGEAESRPDQRTLLSLGAEPRLRRRIAAARAAVLAFVAGLLAVPAGLLPIWGIFTSRDAPMAVPGIEIAGALVVMPLLAVAFAWILSRPIPDWNAFRNIEAR
ncbi:MAG TPA: FtsX-like permease family protein [Candidatus Limnocylindrales bacterium]|nr:FtsX-like permease family protein [Candidatus Limnocylindrales bacterium]